MYGFALLLIAIVLSLLSVWLFFYCTNYKRIKHIVGISPIPIIGSFWQLRRPKDVVYNSLKLLKRHGSLFKGMGGFRTVIFSSNAKFTEFVLSSNKILRKSYIYDIASEWLGEGLLTSTGEKWAKRRKLLTPCFHFNILEQFIEVFNYNSSILVQKLRKETDKESTDIYKYVNLCTLDVICETAMGIKINAQENEDLEYVKAVKEISNIIVNRMLNPLTHSSFAFMLTSNYYKQKKLLKILHGTTDSVIRKRRELLLKESNNENGDDGKKKGLALLDMLLRSSIDGKPLTDKDIREEVDTFMFEGHDTTSSGISFALYNIAKYPDIQTKIMDELQSIFGKDKRPAYAKDLQEMKYLDLVIKESLRLYPPVPNVGRLVENDVAYGKSILPKYTVLLMTIMLTHRNPELYSNPNEFDPERFLLDNRSGKHPFSYIPFSAGPRNCIGQKFAILEMKSTISKILRHYELLPVEDFEPALITDMTLKSSNGILIRLKERELN